MARRINCECGQTITAENDDELVQKAEAHVRESHPEMVGKVTREQLLGMAEDA